MSTILIEKNIELIIDEIYNRISLDIPYDSELKIYNLSILKKVNSFFEEREEYEKCIIVTSFIKKRYNHDINYHLDSKS